jgi:hypothetical protein
VIKRLRGRIEEIMDEPLLVKGDPISLRLPIPPEVVGRSWFAVPEELVHAYIERITPSHMISKPPDCPVK